MYSLKTLSNNSPYTLHTVRVCVRVWTVSTKVQKSNANWLGSSIVSQQLLKQESGHANRQSSVVQQ